MLYSDLYQTCLECGNIEAGLLIGGVDWTNSRCSVCKSQNISYIGDDLYWVDEAALSFRVGNRDLHADFFAVADTQSILLIEIDPLADFTLDVFYRNSPLTSENWHKPIELDRATISASTHLRKQIESATNPIRSQLQNDEVMVLDHLELEWSQEDVRIEQGIQTFTLRYSFGVVPAYYRHSRIHHEAEDFWRFQATISRRAFSNEVTLTDLEVDQV